MELPVTLYFVYMWLWLLGTIIYLNAKDPGFMPKFKPFPFEVKEQYNVRYKQTLLPRNTCCLCTNNALQRIKLTQSNVQPR